MKIIKLFVTILLLSSTSYSAYCKLQNGKKGNFVLIDTISVYDSLEKSFRVKTKEGLNTLVKKQVVFLVINTDTIRFVNNRAVHSDGSLYNVAISFNEEYTKDEIESKIKTFGKLKSDGIKVGCIGATMTLLGVILVSNADWETQQTINGSRTSSQDGTGVIGVLLIIPGIPIGLTGLILSGIGGSKVTEYEKRLKRISFGIGISHESTLLSLRYSF